MDTFMRLPFNYPEGYGRKRLCQVMLSWSAWRSPASAGASKVENSVLRRDDEGKVR